MFTNHLNLDYSKIQTCYVKTNWKIYREPKLYFHNGLLIVQTSVLWYCYSTFLHFPTLAIFTFAVFFAGEVTDRSLQPPNVIVGAKVV